MSTAETPSVRGSAAAPEFDPTGEFDPTAAPEFGTPPHRARASEAMELEEDGYIKNEQRRQGMLALRESSAMAAEDDIELARLEAKELEEEELEAMIE